jgi:hypothetical protein
MIDRGIDAREGAEERAGGHSFLIRRITLGIERLRVGHPTAHPKNDDSIGRGFSLLCQDFHRDKSSRKTGG